MTERPRVLLSGYYGFGNAGDEAILAGLIEAFRSVAPQACLTVLSGDPAGTRSEHGVAAAPRGLARARRQLQECDLLVSGGGGLLQDATSWQSPLYYLGIMRLARAADVPVACVGQSIGPLRRWWVRKLVRRELSQAALVAVRDRASAEALRGLGVTRPIEVTADAAFLLPRPGSAEVSAAWQQAGVGRPEPRAVAIALRRPLGGSAAELTARLAAGLAPVSRQLRLHPVLLPMHYPRDLPFAEGLQRAMAAAAGTALASTVVRARLSARHLLALVAGCDLVAAMRLHALVFAAICRVPLVAVSYDPKVDGMMEELGLSVATSTQAFDAQALARSLLQTWEAREAVSRQLNARVGALRASALRNVELILPLLASRGGGAG